MYELHVCQNGEWKRLRTFEAHRDAMSASIELECTGDCSGTKIFKLAPDPDRLGLARRLVYRWSRDDEDANREREAEETLDRQKAARRRIRADKLAAQARRRKLRRGSLAVGGVSFALAVLLVALQALRAG